MRLSGFLLFIAGIFLAIWIKQKQFKRTNKYGVEEFGSMHSKALLPPIEKMLWYLAVVCIFGGGLFAFF